jgi:hypothetical protein
MKFILEHELTPTQQQQPHYQWDPHGEKGPSRKARSLHDAIVHKHLGHKNAAHHIYQHGLPRLLDAVAAPRRRDSATAAEHRGVDQPAKDPSEAVQAALAEAVHWLVALASAIFSRKKDTHMPLLHMLSTRPEDLSPEQRQERHFRTSSFREIAAQFAKAKTLAADRDSGKRTFENMSPADQQLLEDFDTDVLARRRKKILAQKLPPFRSQVSSASAAAEHAAASSSASAHGAFRT